jgi:hypothetical protein
VGWDDKGVVWEIVSVVAFVGGTSAGLWLLAIIDPGGLGEARLFDWQETMVLVGCVDFVSLKSQRF